MLSAPEDLLLLKLIIIFLYFAEIDWFAKHTTSIWLRTVLHELCSVGGTNLSPTQQ